jgi:hypothetical protein
MGGESMKITRKLSVSLVLAVSFTVINSVQVTAVAAEFSMKQEPTGDTAIYIDDQLFTRYVTSDKVSNKCYFWPIVGPGGIKMTRAYPMQNVEGEKQDHPHHRSVCFGLHSANGFNTWHEVLTFTKKGKVDPHKAAHLGHQVHTKVSKAEASGNAATLVVESENVTPNGEVYMLQTRTVDFHVADNGSRVMDIEIVLKGIQDEITIHDMKDSGLTVRVAHSMCVDAKEDGRIINSNGDANGDAWGKRVSWVDFNGPVEGKTMGVAMLNHPDSFRYPTPWHVRNYGLFTANPFALKEVAGEKDSGDVDLAKGQSITLRHRIIFHAGDEKTAKIAEAWKAYTK